MPAPHPLNQAVVTQALHDLRNGQLRRCLAMGFSEHDLDILKQPTLLTLLVNTRVPWCKVTVNKALLRRLVGQAQHIEEEIAAVDRVLRLGGSSEMICQCYGLTHQEVALRREILGLEKRKGRYPVLTEEQESALWRVWQEHGAPEDDPSLLALTTELAESLDVPLAALWMRLQNWIENGLEEES